MLSRLFYIQQHSVGGRMETSFAWETFIVLHFVGFNSILKIIEEMSTIDAVYFHLVEEAC